MRHCALLLALTISLPALAAPLTLHVSPQGRDAWSGSLAAPNAAATDGPLATITAARDRARQARAADPVIIQLRGGAYRMTEPLILTPRDSFTHYLAYPGETPVLSGGAVIGGWQPGAGELWRATIPEAADRRWQFQQLFVNGQRRTRARTPNLVQATGDTPLGDLTGYHTIARKAPPLRDPVTGKETPRDNIAFLYRGDDIRDWPNLNDVNVVVYHSWETSRHRIAGVDEANRLVTFTGKAVWPFDYFGPRPRYFVENLPEALDEPGEWYLDYETGVVTYWPLPGEDLRTAEVVAPRLTELVRLQGDARAGLWIEDVTFEGLTFSHEDWVLEPGGHSDPQAVVSAPAAIMLDGARDCRFLSCEISHTGDYAIWLRAGCKDNTVHQCRMRDLGIGGIRLGEANMPPADEVTTSGNLIDNNHLFDGGHVYPAGHGIWVGQSYGNTISHNEIHDFRYSGMSLGWDWGDSPTRTHDNIIEYNHVHHCMNRQLNDGGAIYTLGTSPRSVIRNNVFHDIWPFSAIGWGIYLDATSNQYLVENNIVYNTLAGALMYQNGGHEHVIQNNVLGPCAQNQIWPYWEKRLNTFRRNLLFFRESELFSASSETSLRERVAAGETPAVWDDNLYWNPLNPGPKFYGYDFAAWQGLGLDRGSVIADPQWADADPKVFPLPELYGAGGRAVLFPPLKPTSPALKLGFKPIDVSKVGLYGDAAWVAEARSVRHAPTVFPPPAPPAPPMSVDDGFEDTLLGDTPNGAYVSGQNSGASIAITDEKAAEGQRSLRVTDTATVEPAWEPHFFYSPMFRSGLVRQSFDLNLQPSALMYTEWRDTGAYPQNIGPSVTFDASDGQSAAVIVDNQIVTAVPLNQWVHVEIEEQLGKDEAAGWKLTITVPDQPPWSRTDLPRAGDRFEQLHWLGFVSTATVDSAYHLDNVKVSLIER